MLFSGGSAAKPKKDERKEKKSDRDEKYEIQETVFVRWGNSLLANEPLKEFRDLTDMKYISSVTHIVTGSPVTTTGNKLDDCQALLTALGDVKTVASDLAEGQQKAVLSTWWNMVQAFWRRLGPDPIRNDKLSEAIKNWCLEVTNNYEQVSVNDFISSWRDGYAFNCLLHNFDRKLVSMRKLTEMTASERLENAFSVAEKELQVSRLLTVKDLQSEHLDSHSVITYLMTLYLSLIGKSSLGSPPTSSAVPTSQSPQEPAPQPLQETALSEVLQREPSTSQEQPPQSPLEKQPERAKPTTQQSVDQPSESVEGRSRKSSSSSQKSGKTKRERKEVMTREFENCLEDVLSWLLEAEEELSLLSPVEEKDVAIVRKQFKEFEQFMCSLTDSQETVGKVLHRGQMLSAKAESEEEKEAILAQLRIVNQRWEELRAMALHRQTKLQHQLNHLQNKQLALITRWLTEIESRVTETDPVSTSRKRILEQIEEHTTLQNEIEEFQPNILALNSFVAVVDDGESAAESVSSLEKSMREIGDRWQTLCGWAETRSSQLDGLADIVTETSEVYERLNSWFKEREHDLLGLKSAHHLEEQEQVAEQVRKLQQAETALEAEHSQFVRLSQLSCELVARLDTGNGAEANEVRRRLDTITQRWDNLVARIEEHSKTLVRSGKADLRQLHQVQGASTDERSSPTIDEALKQDRVVVVPKEDSSRVNVTTLEAVDAATTDTDNEEMGNQLVERFLRHVARLSQDMDPLRQWMDGFSVSKRPDQLRKMIAVCQEKLIEIKDQEAKVTRLQLELEHLHGSNLNAKQLRTANDAFDKFAKGWAMIVTKISEAMNHLTGHDDSEEAAVANAIEQWISGCDKVLSAFPKVAASERWKRLDRLEDQLKVQTNNLEFVQKDVARKAILNKGLAIVQKKIQAARADIPDISVGQADVEKELDGEWSSVGDQEALEKDLKRSETLVEKARSNNMNSELIERAETRRAEMQERRRATSAASEKVALAETTLIRIRDNVVKTSKSNADLFTIVAELNAARDDLASHENQKKEAERATEKMLALDDNVPSMVVARARERIRELAENWKKLAETIEDHASCAQKEHKRAIQKAISDEERLLEKLEKTLAASESATDAEECCEHLDNLENLLEKVASTEQIPTSAMEESFVRDTYQRLSDTKEKIQERAKKRVDELTKAVEECEKFERQMASFQQWATTMYPLLSSRIAADVSALDVPEEYQLISSEFDEWNKVLEGLEKWLSDGERSSNERSWAQLKHSQNTYDDLLKKFNEFKKPKGFEERLDKVRSRLSDVEMALDDLTGIEGSDCERALEDVKAHIRALQTLQEDVADLAKGEQQLTEGRVIDASLGQTLRQKIHDAGRKSKELSVRAESAVDRLEDCVSLYNRLEKKAKEVEKFLEDSESSLDKFVAEDKSSDDGEVTFLISEWNRREVDLRELEDAERMLREQAVRVDDRLTVELRRRAEMLKKRLDNWSRTLENMEADEEEQLLQLDEMHHNLLTQLRAVADKPTQQIADTLRFLRGDRDRLSSRARRLAAKNPRLANVNMISEVSKEWDELEKKLAVPETKKIEIEPAKLEEGLAFPEQVEKLHDHFAKAYVLLDFDTNPVSSAQQWHERVEALDHFLANSRPALDALVEAGRDLATKGRLELSTHTAIDRLDELCDVVDVLEQKLEEQREKISPVLARAESLARDAVVLEGVVDQLSSRDLNDEQVVKATRRDLVERDNQLSQLSQRAAAIHSTLPGASSQSRDTSLASLCEKLAQLEEKLSKKSEKKPPSPRTSPEGTSGSSAGPLAMEAYGTTTDAQTQDEEDKPAEKKRKIIAPGESSQEREEEPKIIFKQPETIMMEVEEGADMDRVYEDLAWLEEKLLEEEEFPMEGIEDAEERYNDYEKRITQSEKVINDNQMTLDMLQTEASLERINNLRRELAERQSRLHPLKREWAEFMSSLEQTEALVNVPERKREPSPALNELEQEVVSKEQRISRAEQHVCDVIRRLGVILPRMNQSSSKAVEIRNRVRDLEDKFKEISARVQEERIRLETRAISQSDLSKQLEELIFWCDEAATELTVKPNPLDPLTLEQALNAIKRKINEVETKKVNVTQLEISKEQLLGLESVPPEAKHHIRRAVCDVAKRLADLRSDLSDRKVQLEQEKENCDAFWIKTESMATRATDLCRRVAAVNSAQLFTPSGDHISSCRADAHTLEKDIITTKDKVQEANQDHDKLSSAPEKRLLEVLVSCEAAVAVTGTLPESSRSSTSQVPSESMLSSQLSSQGTIIPSTRLAESDRTSPASEVPDEEESSEEEIEEPEPAGSLTASRHSAISEASTAHLSSRDASNWNALTQLRHWLTEAERDAGLTVDLSDHVAIRNMTSTVQGIADQVRLKLMDVVGLQDSSAAAEVKQKARDLGVDMDRVAKQCEKRRTQLAVMGEASRMVDTARANMELWLEKVESTLGEKRSEETTEETRRELEAINEIVQELDTRKDAMAELNQRGNDLLDEYKKDEAHQLSHLLSRVNMRWTCCNDNVRIRRAGLEARLRSRNDFHTALDEFEEWLTTTGEELEQLDNSTNNTQAIKDTQRRREWTHQHKALHAAVDAHGSVFNAVEEMGRKMGASLEVGREKSELLQRMDKLTERWNSIKVADEAVKDRLENAEQEWEKLTHNLSTHLTWIETKMKETLGQQPVGGTLSSVMSQGAWVKTLEREIEARGPAVRETIASAHSYLMQHDLRPKMHKPGVLSDEQPDTKDSEQRRYGLQIFANCEQLKEKWSDLGKQLAEWHQTVQAAAQKLQELEGALAECQLHLSTLEAEMDKLTPVEELRLEDLKTARADSETLGVQLDSVRVHVDDANEICGKILAADQPLDLHPRNQRDDVNRRFAVLRTKLRSRVAALKNALADFGPSSEHFLNQSVTSPWQRAISKTNQLPYYIDHTTEHTQWEHPVWVEMYKELAQFNRVKFIAYRTAMKLRALQKRLCLDLIELPLLEKCFNRLSGLSNEESPALEGMVCTLLPLYEELHKKYPQQVRSVALAVDLCINFLLNLFDPVRDGTLRVLSFKIAMVAFSNAPLEEKYRYFFSLVAQDGQASQKQIALLLYDLIHIPRLVGEAAAFGGANVEPSVRSCFESVRLAPNIAVGPFLDWVKREPQSIVWLPVMHRLATAEFAKHSAKCNVCKMFPIVGLRYRCLRCFNVDLCQNCFFSQRTAKSHKLKHPMQEYAQPTTSAEDARDFATMVRNKFGRYRRNLGYLPVDVADEGKPLASPPQLARNPETDALHQRTASMASRLAILTASQHAEPREEVTEVKSPAQLINQVDQMHKDELDQLLQRLQLENLELKRELEKRKSAAASTPHLDRTGHMSPEAHTSRRSEQRGGTLPRLSNASHGRSAPSLKSAQSQSDVMDEARALRLHKQRLEHRSRILEQQNEQLELQLQRLKKMIDQQKESSSRFDSTSAERDWIEPTPVVTQSIEWQENGERRQTRMHSLLATVDDLGRAMENLVVSVVYDSEPED